MRVITNIRIKREYTNRGMRTNDCKQKIDEAIGWYGAIALMGAYFLVSFGYVLADSVVYQTLNITGALGIVWISFVKTAYQSAVLNIVWAIIGITALVRMFL